MPDQSEDTGVWGLMKRVEEQRVVRVAMLVLAIAATIAFLHFARFILIPIVLAVFLSYVLTPFVQLLTRIRIPGTKWNLHRGIASLIVVLTALLMASVLGVFIVDQARDFVLELPKYQDRVGDAVVNWQQTMFELEERLESFVKPILREDLPNGADEPFVGPVLEPSDAEAIRVFLEQRTDFWGSLYSYIYESIPGLLGFLGQIFMCIFVLFFILLEGPVMRTKVINTMGTSLRRRRILLEILHNVNEDVQRYLFNRVVTNTLVACIVGLVFYAYGLKYAFLVGVLAGIFNFIPYVGPIIGAVFPALIAFMQFGEWTAVLQCVIIYTAITGLEGNMFTPIVLGRHLKLNSLAVLLSAIFWGWLWGPIGLILAVPIMAVFKAIAEHVDSIRPVGELLRG